MTVRIYVLFRVLFSVSLVFSAVKGKTSLEELLAEYHSTAGKFVRKAFDAITGGICVTAFTTPLIAAAYYEIPVYSFVLNLLVVPLITILMCMGILILISG